MRLPSTSPITLSFGATSAPYSPGSPHAGTDFAYIPDNKIYAPFSGDVILMPNNGRDGNGIYMHNADQFHGMLHSSRYLVSNGQHVEEGQPIAIMGDTGFAQGVHLHWCVKVGSQFIDPMSLIKQEEQPMTKQEAVAVLDAFYGRLAGRKVKQSELDEYVPEFTSGNSDNFFKKAAGFDEVKATVGSTGGALDKGSVLAYINQNLK